MYGVLMAGANCVLSTTGYLDADARAIEKVKELLGRHEELTLPDDVDEELREYVARRRTELPEMVA